MNFKDYKDYIKNNPDGYWFKNKLFGWGWMPVRWQGLVVTLVYFLLIILFSMTIDNSSPNREVLFTFILPFILLTIIFTRILYKKGEKPRWRWGTKKKD